MEYNKQQTAILNSLIKTENNLIWCDFTYGLDNEKNTGIDLMAWGEDNFLRCILDEQGISVFPLESNKSIKDISLENISQLEFHLKSNIPEALDLPDTVKYIVEIIVSLKNGRLLALHAINLAVVQKFALLESAGIQIIDNQNIVALSHFSTLDLLYDACKVAM
ncbi:MAG: hypothetical protein ACRC6X_05455 [Culicoidibacterales bacterium]